MIKEVYWLISSALGGQSAWRGGMSGQAQAHIFGKSLVTYVSTTGSTHIRTVAGSVIEYDY